jgi:peptidyl-prolyl cis-trans isomerase C
MTRASLCLAILLLLPSLAARAELPPDVLVKNRWVQLTRADWDAAMERIPAKNRFEFAMGAKRVQTMLNGLLLDKTLAVQAKMHGTTLPESEKDLTGLAREKALAKAELARVESKAEASFEARKAEFEARAREIWKANPENYQVPEEVRVSDITILFRGRTDDAARARAQEARAKVLAGNDFAAVAREYSEDRTTRDKGGALPFVTAKRLVPSFARGVFALKNVGDVSPPIKTPSGYHIVRLEERKPARTKTFDEAHDEIMAELEKSYVAQERQRFVDAIFADPSTEVNQASVDALVNRVDPKVLRQTHRTPVPLTK